MKLDLSFYDAFRTSLKELTATEQGAVMTALVELTEDPSSPGL